jgi:tripartite-type tricarboxylate transporter receptor subunit TctC
VNPLRFSAVAVSLALLLIKPAQGSGMDYPSRPIKVIIPSSAGGGTDLSFRVLAKAVEPGLGQSLEIINKPADSGVEGLVELAMGVPDGYTLGAVFSGQLTASPQIRQLSFTPIASTIQPDYVICAHKDFPAGTGAELVALLREKPLSYTYGNDGRGGGGYFAAEIFFDAAGVLLRSQDFNGSADAARHFAAKKVDF